jgi:hypothetical protein
MIQELEIGVRGCGKRKPGGLYLIGDGAGIDSAWLPKRLVCQHCGLASLKPSRNIQKFYPARLFPELDSENQVSVWPGLPTFAKEDIAFAITVGELHYPTPEDYISEAKQQGISRLVRVIPHNFELGKTWVFLIHPKAFENQDMLGPAFEPGIIAMFRPKEIQYVTTGDETPFQIFEIEKRGIVPVKVSYHG